MNPLEQKTNSFELKYAHLVPKVWEALSKLPRQGWVDRGVKNPESVQEHTVALRRIASEMFVSLPELSSTEKQDLLDMLEIHDWPESKPEVGDRVIIRGTEEEKKKLRKEKYEAEYKAMEEICAPLNEKGKHIFGLWLRYGKQEDLVSKLSHQIDKYQAIEKAFEYEKQGEPVSTQEFIDHQGHIVTNSYLLGKLNAIKEVLSQ